MKGFAACEMYKESGKKKNGMCYPPEVDAFAHGLLIQSPMGYRFVCEALGLPSARHLK